MGHSIAWSDKIIKSNIVSSIKLSSSGQRALNLSGIGQDMSARLPQFAGPIYTFDWMTGESRWVEKETKTFTNSLPYRLFSTGQKQKYQNLVTHRDKAALSYKKKQ